jgi:hypothetical protein
MNFTLSRAKCASRHMMARPRRGSWRADGESLEGLAAPGDPRGRLAPGTVPLRRQTRGGARRLRTSLLAMTQNRGTPATTCTDGWARTDAPHLWRSTLGAEKLWSSASEASASIS